MAPILKVEDLTKHFVLASTPIERLRSKKRRLVHAVDEVSFEVGKGDIFSLVGETGSGKTTIGKMIVGLIEPTAGTISFEASRLDRLSKQELKQFRRRVQMIFQDPFASLNPRMTVGDIIGLPLKVHQIATDVHETVMDLMEKVGLSPASEMINRHPHEFSGGQRQRIGIARAIALNPQLVIADEPVASLDVSIRAQILNLLMHLKDDLKLTYVLIAHDLSVVRYMSDWVAVLYLGKIVELAEVKELFANPRHPYTRLLISSVPIPDPKVTRQRMRMLGDMPDPINPPSGCRFHTRCPFVKSSCSLERPQLIALSKDHYVACPTVD